jgi:hypothetical protein
VSVFGALIGQGSVVTELARLPMWPPDVRCSPAR